MGMRTVCSHGLADLSDSPTVVLPYPIAGEISCIQGFASALRCFCVLSVAHSILARPAAFFFLFVSTAPRGMHQSSLQTVCSACQHGSKNMLAVCPSTQNVQKNLFWSISLLGCSRQGRNDFEPFQANWLNAHQNCRSEVSALTEASKDRKGPLVQTCRML